MSTIVASAAFPGSMSVATAEDDFPGDDSLFAIVHDFDEVLLEYRRCDREAAEVESAIHERFPEGCPGAPVRNGDELFFRERFRSIKGPFCHRWESQGSQRWPSDDSDVKPYILWEVEELERAPFADPAAQARADEICKAARTWEAGHDALCQKLGIDKLWNRVDQLNARLWQIAGKISETPASTLPGLIAKARVLGWTVDGEKNVDPVSEENPDPSADERLLWSIARDLLSIGKAPSIATA